MADAAIDAIVIGSGFGGAMAAQVLVREGWRVLLLERGDWVDRGAHNWVPEGVGPLTCFYSSEAPRTFHCVGGPSVFYGGVSLRFREADFLPNPEITEGSGAAWPFNYRELEPYYAEAERILGVAGVPGTDPTEPPRSAPYPQGSADLAPVSRRLEAAARGLGLNPFRLPLAIDRKRCLACGTCDGFACAVSAKNDLATVVIRPLLRNGLRLETNAVVTRLHAENGRVTGVESVHRETGERTVHHAPHVFLAAGALATPHLLLASGLQRHNPGADVIGRYLMRHYNEILLGIFPRRPNPERVFHKQLGIHDFYFGDPASGVRGKLGGLQQLTTPPAGLVRAELPWPIGAACAPLVEHLTGWLTIAEDQPRYENRVELTSKAVDRYGLPGLVIQHHHTARDRAAGEALARRARAILSRAGAWSVVRHRVATFSHGVGTVRLGTDPRTSALDGECRFRGLDNLYIVDGSVMPTSAAVNPSLTIAAVSLRAARRLVARSGPSRADAPSRA
ncbi:MAG: GMC family oxidoreductase, partial [Gemmatimonadales bacterium]|nr:GMC family oxidoreductase [Gemmatimonadales bacterium]